LSIEVKIVVAQVEDDIAAVYELALIAQGSDPRPCPTLLADSTRDWGVVKWRTVASSGDPCWD
jgi:hypothetical protein